MTAWELLVANSSLVSGTAWEHLNAQTGGSGQAPGEGQFSILLRSSVAARGGMLTDVAVPVELVAVLQDGRRTCYSSVVSRNG